jgi:hypothetical protein
MRGIKFSDVSGEPIWINAEHVNAVMSGGSEGATTIYTQYQDFEVLESQAEVVARLGWSEPGLIEIDPETNEPVKPESEMTDDELNAKWAKLRQQLQDADREESVLTLDDTKPGMEEKYKRLAEEQQMAIDKDLALTRGILRAHEVKYTISEDPGDLKINDGSEPKSDV